MKLTKMWQLIAMIGFLVVITLLFMFTFSRLSIITTEELLVYVTAFYVIIFLIPSRYQIYCLTGFVATRVFHDRTYCLILMFVAFTISIFILMDYAKIAFRVKATLNENKKNLAYASFLKKIIREAPRKFRPIMMLALKESSLDRLIIPRIFPQRKRLWNWQSKEQPLEIWLGVLVRDTVAKEYKKLSHVPYENVRKLLEDAAIQNLPSTPLGEFLCKQVCPHWTQDDNFKDLFITSVITSAEGEL